MAEKPPLVDQPGSKPTRKVTASTIGAAAGAALSQVMVNAIDLHVPLLAGADVSALIYLVVPAVTAYAFGWLTRDRAPA
ncbi:hypothetical protein [Amorphus sp. MBR-141]